jgi:hypothetical protein
VQNSLPASKSERARFFLAPWFTCNMGSVSSPGVHGILRQELDWGAMTPVITTEASEVGDMMRVGLQADLLNVDDKGFGTCPGTEAPCWSIPTDVGFVPIVDDTAATKVLEKAADAMNASVTAIIGGANSILKVVASEDGLEIKMTIIDGEPRLILTKMAH